MGLQTSGRSNPKANPIQHRLTIALLIIYLVALFWILILKLGVQFSYMDKRSVNLIPFKEPSIFSSENVLNLVIFTPLGIYLGVLMERWNFGKKLLIFFLLSLLVEGLQYLLQLGAFDITDLITNTSGGVFGLLIFSVLRKVFDNGIKAQKFINIVAATGTFLMIVLLVLLKMNMLPIRYQ